MMKDAAKSFVGMGTPTEVIIGIFDELFFRYQSESNLFFDDDSEFREEVLKEALELVSLNKGDIGLMSQGDIKLVENAWDQLFNYLSEIDIGFNSLDDLFDYLNRTISPVSGGNFSNDEEFPDLVAEVKSSNILPERLSELATDNVNWFNEYEETDVKILIAKNPSTPRTALDVLSKSTNHEIRLNVARNPNTERQTLERLMSDSEKIVKKAAQERIDQF